MIGWLSSAALAGAGVSVQGSGVLQDCLDQEQCGDTVTRRAEDALRVAGMAGEPAALGISPAVVRGSGFALELAAQSVPGLTPPRGVDLVPAIPRIGFGGVGGDRLRYGGGIEAGGAVPLDGVDIGFAAGARGGFALGSPTGRQWVGFEADAGYALVQGVLFDRPEQAAAELGAGAELPSCPYPCNDLVNLLHVGLDSVLAVDIDPTAVVLLRLGGVFQYQSLNVAYDRTTWTFAGFVPRATVGAAYRFGTNGLLGAAARFGLTEPTGPLAGPMVPWTATVMAGWRFGADAAPPRPRTGPNPTLPPTPAPIVVAAPVPAPVIQVPRVKVVQHPDLACDEGRVATGDPPPTGNEAWCVTVDPLTGRLVLDGAYIKWYDADHIEQRGQHLMDHRVGTWVHYDASGAIDTIGDYVDGLMTGTWRTYWPDGTARSEMRFESGRQTGESVDWGPDGRTCVVGQWTNGERDGVWREYVDGALVNERTYRGGLLMAEQRF